MIIVDLSRYYSDTAKLADLDDMVQKALLEAGEGHEVVLTGKAPIWLYLKVAHALHGKARKLFYRSPQIGDKDLLIFDHDPF